jgi:ribosome maturation protein SDO1
VSGKERDSASDKIYKEIARIVAEKTVDTRTGLAFTPASIERAMHEAKWVVSPSRGAKQQALDLIKVLEKREMGLRRAPMRLKVSSTAEEDAAEVSFYI